MMHGHRAFTGSPIWNLPKLPPKRGISQFFRYECSANSPMNTHAPTVVFSAPRFMPTQKISQNLRDNFILHWSSERAVPVVTIDMGDGRILKRTLTGNSAHYLLDAQGRPLDVLPGLYSPGAFEEWLQNGEALFKECNGLEGAERREKLKAWHENEIIALADQYMTELKAGNPEYWKKADPKVADQSRANTLQSLKNTAILEANPLLQRYQTICRRRPQKRR